MILDFSPVIGLFDGANHMTIVSHIRPDGDAIGSLLALSRSLHLAGKKVSPVSVDGVPGKFSFLCGAGEVLKQPPKTCDLLIAVDCSDMDRLGIPPDQLPRKPDLNIDHHPTNTHFADFNLVAPEAASSAEILYRLIHELELPLDCDVATALMAGIVTDTIGFRTPNVSPSTLEAAAELMKLGASLAEVYEESLHKRSFEAVRYWGAGLSRLERLGGIVWTSLMIDDRRQVSYPGKDDADLTNLLTTLNDADIVVLFIEQEHGKIKVSWRSRPGFDVAELAGSFGGGGHNQAAGAIINGDLEDVRSHVLSETKTYYENALETAT